MDQHSARLSRRHLVAGAAAGAAIAATGGLSAPQFAAAQDLKEVARERTLILRWAGVDGQYIDHELWNGYIPTANHQNGLGILHEPLAYYSAFADTTYPWLAESWEYNADSTQLTLETRQGVTWSSGTPFSAEDVAYTINSAKEFKANIKWGSDVATFVDKATATDANTCVVDFTIPAPRFMFFMTYKYDIGLYIVPKHIFEGQDWATFKNFDIAAGLPVTTGPWRVVAASPQQKVIDRADSWWAVDAGLVAAMPAVERIIYLPVVPDEQLAQQLISNEIDCSLDLRVQTIATLLGENPAITTHTGSEAPYGYVDWWPTSLYVNNERTPYSDVNVRWAISHYIDRDQMIEFALDGAGSTWPLPLPSYPGLQKFVDAAGPLLAEFDTLEYNPEKGDAKLTESGWAKNGDRTWETDGAVLTAAFGR